MGKGGGSWVGLFSWSHLNGAMCFLSLLTNPPPTSSLFSCVHLHRHTKVHLITTPLAAVHLFLQMVNASHAITQKGTGFLYFGHLRVGDDGWKMSVHEMMGWWEKSWGFMSFYYCQDWWMMRYGKLIRALCNKNIQILYFRKSRRVYPFQRKVVFQPLWFRGYVSSLEGINISGCYSPNGLISCCFKYRLQHLALRYAWFEETRHSRPLLMWVD